MREWKKLKRRKIKVDNVKNQLNRKDFHQKQQKLKGKKQKVS